MFISCLIRKYLLKSYTTKSPLPNIVEGVIDHYSFNDMPHGEAPIQLEGVLEQQELEEQVITGEPLIRALDDEDQPETSTRRS